MLPEGRRLDLKGVAAPVIRPGAAIGLVGRVVCLPKPGQQLFIDLSLGLQPDAVGAHGSERTRILQAIRNRNPGQFKTQVDP